MAKKPAEMTAQDAEALKAMIAEGEQLREEIIKLCGRVPGSVLSGSVQTAQAWKARASDAYLLANSKRPSLAALRNARDGLLRGIEA